MKDLKQKILDRVKDDLAEIETALAENLTPYLELVSQTASHILFSGGKRLRPLLMVLSARLCGYDGGFDKTFSCVFEYLHAATLLHDDLVDDAHIRRGKTAAHEKWGNATAVLVGDFLLARSLSIASETGSVQVIKIIAEITENMSQGEIHQMQNKGRLDFSEKEYLEIIRRKTAVLIEGACRVGAIIADADEEKESALAEYGANIGLAFQMADDLLDYLADSQILGKQVGADLAEGKLTLPIIVSLRTAEPDDRLFMQKLIREKTFTREEFEKLKKLLKKYNGLRHTYDLASEKVARAKKALTVFKPSAVKELLENIADYALNRNV